MFKGSMVALVTPMHESGGIDWDSLESLINWQIDEGTDAIVTVGTTGESTTLSLEEHKSVVQFTVDIVAKKIPVIAGAGANSTSEALELTTAAYKAGCDATLQVTPYYNKPPQRGLYQHFKTIAEQINLPLILYNVPSRTACDILPDTVLSLSKVKNIIGIKEASNFERLQILKKTLASSEFKIYCGEDGITAKALCDELIDGVISVTTNVAPKQMHEMLSAGLNKKFDQCLKINDFLSPLHEVMFVETSPMAVKYALYKMNKIKNGIRLPLVELTDENKTTVSNILKELSII